AGADHDVAARQAVRRAGAAHADDLERRGERGDDAVDGGDEGELVREGGEHGSGLFAFGSGVLHEYRHSAGHLTGIRPLHNANATFHPAFVRSVPRTTLGGAGGIAPAPPDSVLTRRRPRGAGTPPGRRRPRPRAPRPRRPPSPAAPGTARPLRGTPPPGTG